MKRTSRTPRPVSRGASLPQPGLLPLWPLALVSVPVEVVDGGLSFPAGTPVPARPPRPAGSGRRLKRPAQ